MTEIVSNDTLDWARDLAAIMQCFAGGEPQQPAECRSAAIFEFALYSSLHNLHGQPEKASDR